jgi:ankyrin repeat protein
MERQSSFRPGALEKLKSFRMVSLERRSRDSPGKRGDTPLHLAARSGSVPHAQKILAELDRALVGEMAARQNQDGETPLYVAAEKGHAEVVRLILMVSDLQMAGIKANNSFDAFHIAAKQGHLGKLFLAFFFLVSTMDYLPFTFISYSIALR